jgi:hypothetical protein
VSGGLENIQRDGKPVAGAEPENDRAVKHGAKATLKLAPRVEEIRRDLADLVPVATEADLPAVTLLAWQLARIEAANSYLDEVGITDGKGKPRPVLNVLSTWENSAARLCDQLGLTPTSRARLGVDLARMKGGNALAEHIAKNYGKDAS